MTFIFNRLLNSLKCDSSDAKVGQAPIYFLHIPKTAGSSVREIMLETFGDRLCPVQMWDDFFRPSDGLPPLYDAYLGHFGMDLPTFVGSQMRIFTLLREPIARTVSHYNQVRRTVKHPMYDRVSNQSLREFVFDPETAPMIANFQARYLVSRDISISELANIFTPFWDSLYSLQVAWENASCYMSTAMLERKAMASLKSFAFVGTTEGFDDDVDLIRGRFGFTKGQVARANSSSAQETTLAIEPDVAERIAHLTNVDQLLYAAALKMRR